MKYYAAAAWVGASVKTGKTFIGVGYEKPCLEMWRDLRRKCAAIIREKGFTPNPITVDVFRKSGPICGDIFGLSLKSVEVKL